MRAKHRFFPILLVALIWSTLNLFANEQENHRRARFFENQALFTNPITFFKNGIQASANTTAIPLSDIPKIDGNTFSLFAEQPYSFLLRSKEPFTFLHITLYKQGRTICQERIELPTKNTLSWEKYLVESGSLYIPATRLKTEAGIDLRIRFVPNKELHTLIIEHRSQSSEYTLSIATDTSDQPLYTCEFLEPPPWQLQRTSLPKIEKPLPKHAASMLAKKPAALLDKKANGPEMIPSKLLDDFVKKLNKDPIALAAYVQNEIKLLDPLSYTKDGILYSIGIQRSPETVFLEKAGSAWEQCMLLIYLLRAAGVEACYVYGAQWVLSNAEYKKLFPFSHLDTDHIRIEYPWVVVFPEGNKAESLFPWIQEEQIATNASIYDFLPEKYASGERFVDHYLKNDPYIMSLVGSDKDESVGTLFIRLVETCLQNNELYHTHLKKQFTTWGDFPGFALDGEQQGAPTTGAHFTSNHQSNPFYPFLEIAISPQGNPKEGLRALVPTQTLESGCLYFDLSSDGTLLTNFADYIKTGESLRKFDTLLKDKDLTVTVTYLGAVVQKGNEPYTYSKFNEFTISKGTLAVFCFSYGTVNPEMTSAGYGTFQRTQSIHDLLTLIGSVYFEKCSKTRKVLAELHRVQDPTVFECGFVKLSNPIHNKNTNLISPQIDMVQFGAPSHVSDEKLGLYQQFLVLSTANDSSNEHQVLRELFQDDYVVSTTKLLQMSYDTSKESNAPGFLTFTANSFAHSQEHSAKDHSPQLWRQLENTFSGLNAYHRDYAYAYMTPLPIENKDATSETPASYCGMGCLFLGIDRFYASISNNAYLSNGGFGSYIPGDYWDALTTNKLQLLHNEGDYTSNYRFYSPEFSAQGAYDEWQSMRSESSYDSLKQPLLSTQTQADVRPRHKDICRSVADPIDIITGAYYVDEPDISIPGPFPLEIRRNYTSQNPAYGVLGYGWKLNLNPTLFEKDGKKYASETDGTVLVFSYSPDTDTWIVLPENNPDLSNLTSQGIGGMANPFHSSIKGNTLYSPDGSRRTFKNGLLQKWTDSRNNYLTFTYASDRLSRIESSNGSFCLFHYYHDGKISSIYTQDGRHVSYEYDGCGDLRKITLPNNTHISYEYDDHHRIIRETKPHGQIVENRYTDDKVTEQRSPTGPQDAFITSATFSYADGLTKVTDALGNTTTYSIYKGKVYKITDPLGQTILQSWFLEDTTYFDAALAKELPWKKGGFYPNSLQSCVDTRGLHTFYVYDQSGNVIQEVTTGADLTGDRQTTLEKTYAYNTRNLCVEERLLDKKIITTYDTSYPYLPSRIETYYSNVLTNSSSFTYNDKGQLTEETHSGATTLWQYDQKGFPKKKTQKTGTSDPDVITTYAFNNQGQCIKRVTPDAVITIDYDIMGLPYQTFTHSRDNKLLSSRYMRYNESSQLILEHTENPDNFVTYDYNRSGRLKASCRSISASSKGYTLYDYDATGNLEQETNALGMTTYRSYDPLGRVLSLTQAGITTTYSYKPGTVTMTLPSGATTTNTFATNGLLIHTLHPDGTQDQTTYDLFSRPIKETKNGITWTISYNDSAQTSTRTHQETGDTHVETYDPRGNLISYKDPAGALWKKTYDLLNRLTSETSPTGERTTYTYKNNTLTCLLPSGERSVTSYANRLPVKVETYSADNTPLLCTVTTYDPKTDTQKTLEGTIATTTHFNALGQPISIETGDIKITYTYDKMGNCLSSTDGDGRETRFAYNMLGQLATKTLPDGSTITYTYDDDGNLASYRLPNTTTWHALYDGMGRKIQEHVNASGKITGKWTYIYKDGYLTYAKDPLGYAHAYTYDSHGNLASEAVGDWERSYTYTPNGLLETAACTRDFSWYWRALGYTLDEKTEVRREYDDDGRLTCEAIFLNGDLLYTAAQAWGPSERTLQIGEHSRRYTYQNNRLSTLSSANVDLVYEYDLSGRLMQTLTPHHEQTVAYNDSGMPSHIQLHLPEKTYNKQTLTWYPSGKLASVATNTHKASFSYNTLGYLTSDGATSYSHTQTGLNTLSPEREANRLDAFGRITAESLNTALLQTSYDSMGQTLTQSSRKHTWDPWGNLIHIQDPHSTWEATYDALGRRLQTKYTQQETTHTTTSFYDPETEFLEIGIQTDEHTFWKLHGPVHCDAVLDTLGGSASLVHNTLSELTHVITDQEVHTLQDSLFPYGPKTIPPPPQDLLAYASSLTWHGKSPDPTGLIYMGARHYDPHTARFLSPDPIGYPHCLDLYAYADGDPVNYFDPDGRLAIKAWQIPKVYAPKVAAFIGHAGLRLAYELSEGSADSMDIIGDIGHALFPGLLSDLSAGDNILFSRADTLHEDTLKGHARIDKLFGTDYAGMFQKSEMFPGVVQVGLPYPGAGLSKAAGSSRGVGFTQVSSVRGWRVGQPINNRTWLGKTPKWNTVRARYWKNQALAIKRRKAVPSRIYEVTDKNIARMQKGKAPLVKNPITGKLESVELHHTPPQRVGGLFDIEEITPWDHANVDEYRYIGGKT